MREGVRSRRHRRQAWREKANFRPSMTRRNAPLCCKRRGRRGTFDSPAVGRWQCLCSSGRDLARRLMLRRICIRLGAPRPPQSGFFLGCLRRSRLGPQITILWQQIARSGKPHALKRRPRQQRGGFLAAHLAHSLSNKITPTAGSACVVLLNSPRGQLRA